LEARAGYVKYLQPQGEPFYALYDIKDYTIANAKVVIREQSAQLTAAVVGRVSGKSVIPDHKLSLIATGSSEEAYYLCALINSRPARLLVKAFGISTQISVSTINRLKLGRYDQNNQTHRRLSELGSECSRAAARADTKKVRACEVEVDAAAAELFGISRAEFRKICSEAYEAIVG
jgi:hypothetical protein